MRKYINLHFHICKRFYYGSNAYPWESKRRFYLKMTNNNTVEITSDLANSLKDYFNTHKHSQIVVLTDDNTHKHCYPLVAGLLPEHTAITAPAGEAHKNIQTCLFLWKKMTSLSLDRKALLINLGGGVIGDMGGFAAAAYKRGISFINLPTTLLSQADASVGGKLGIDFQGYKNHIGFFQDPQRIFIWADFLKTLPSNELRSGFAEIIKHSLIGDKGYWNVLKTRALKDQDMKAHVAHAIRFKQGVVEKDPYEQGLRKILNFGHTIGHAIESYFLDKGHKRLLHGEAIAIGMITEAYLSKKLVGLSESELEEITHFILSIYGKVAIDEAIIPDLIQLTVQDKKNEGGRTLMTLIAAIGVAEINCAVNAQEIREAMVFYLNL